jgi:hypothetical protein
VPILQRAAWCAALPNGRLSALPRRWRSSSGPGRRSGEDPRFRVEPSEIEALRAHPGAGSGRSRERMRLERGARLRRACEREVSVADLRRFLRTSCTTWCLRRSSGRRLPLTPNGKVDRALAARDEVVPEEPYVEPRNPVRRRWPHLCRCLASNVGIHDNFFGKAAIRSSVFRSSRAPERRAWTHAAAAFRQPNSR